MTMPSERRRALRWGKATLERIGNDAGAPAELKAEAISVLAAFPDDRAVATCFLEQDDVTLARQMAAIAAAQVLLGRASRCPALSEQTRSAAKVTDRHFPQSLELGITPWPQPLRDWVDLYLLRDLDDKALKQEVLQMGVTDIDGACARLMQSAPSMMNPLHAR